MVHSKFLGFLNVTKLRWNFQKYSNGRLNIQWFELIKNNKLETGKKRQKKSKQSYCIRAGFCCRPCIIFFFNNLLIKNTLMNPKLPYTFRMTDENQANISFIFYQRTLSVTVPITLPYTHTHTQSFQYLIRFLGWRNKINSFSLIFFPF